MTCPGTNPAVVVQGVTANDTSKCPAATTSWLDSLGANAFAAGTILTQPINPVDFRSENFLDTFYNASVAAGSVQATDWDIVYNGRPTVIAYFRIDTPNPNGQPVTKWCASPVYRDTGDTINGSKFTRSCFGGTSEIFRIRTLSGGGVVYDTFSNGQRGCFRINWTGLQFSTGTPVNCTTMQ